MSTSDDSFGDDPSGGMRRAVDSMPEQLRVGALLARDVLGRLRPARRIVVCGMGGSAFPAHLLELFAGAHELDLTISRDYRVAKPVDADTLAFVASFSGETEETIAALDDVLGRNAQVVTLSAGGRLAEIAGQRGLPHLALARPWSGFQPRAASGLFVAAIATVLESLGALPGAHLELDTAAGAFADYDASTLAGALVAHLNDRVPLFYTAAPYVDSVARIAKIKFNENAKVPAFYSSLPEANHNEMVGFTRSLAPFAAVFFEDPDSGEPMRRRMAATRETLAEAGVSGLSIPLTGPSRLARALLALKAVDYGSSDCAISAGIDPNPVQMVETFKQRLNQRPGENA